MVKFKSYAKSSWVSQGRFLKWYQLQVGRRYSKMVIKYQYVWNYISDFFKFLPQYITAQFRNDI